MPMKTENKTNHYIDLHAHLDGCITVDIAKKLACIASRSHFRLQQTRNFFPFFPFRIPAKSSMIF